MSQIALGVGIGAGVSAVIIAGWFYYSTSDDTSPGARANSKAAAKKRGGKKAGKKGKADSGDDIGGVKAVAKEAVEAVTKKGKKRQDVKPKEFVEEIKQHVAPSFAEVVRPEAEKETVGEIKKPKTLAEKKTAKPRKTKVDDMLSADQQPPPLARVMKIVPTTSPIPAVNPPAPAQFSASESDASTSQVQAEPFSATSGSGSNGVDADNDDDAWEVPKQGFATLGQGDDWQKPKKGVSSKTDDEWESVPVKGKKSTASANRFSALQSGSPKSSSPTASSAPTKVQRKNAKAAAEKSAAKQADEQIRLQKLAEYRKEQERAKIAQISSKKGTGGGKVLSGGMSASVNESGSLVWD